MKCKFVGREYELEALQSLTEKNAASLVVVTGRRRIGKSRLVEEFAARHKRYETVFISALAPQPGVTPVAQRMAFAQQMQTAVQMPPVKHDSWLDLFVHLARATARGRWIILLDEISWMGAREAEFLPMLKIAWDQHFKKNPRVILVLCGSVSSWLDRNILSSTGFVGRVSLNLRLGDLPMRDCNAFWGAAKDRVSARDKLKMLSVVGGVPRYLEEIIVSKSTEENIRRLCFRPEGLLLREFEQIFTDLFDRKGPAYKRIVRALADRHCTMPQLFERLGVRKGGVTSGYLEDLVSCGFVNRDYTWDVRKRRTSKLSRFRLKDNYLRFYLRCIEPNYRKIQDQRMAKTPVTAMAGWDSIMGLQFENLVLQSRSHVWDRCGLSPSEIEFEGPFFQPATKRKRGCQVDYLIQTQHGPIYICEIKSTRHRISSEIEREMQDKINRLNPPKRCSILPVLIHASEVSESIQYGNAFAHVIDFTEVLERK